MKLITELVKLIQSGAKPVVQFGPDVGDKESYADPGMRARAISVKDDDRDCVKIYFDFTEFDAFNLPFELTNYYDAAGNPTLTARAAGFYRPQDNLYFEPNENIEKCFELVSDARTGLYTRYLSSGTEETYVAWLESQVLDGAKA